MKENSFALFKYELGRVIARSLNAEKVDQISPADWTQGPKDAPHILIQYGDFQCPACGSYYPLIKKLLKEHGEEFQFVYRHFPLLIHPYARVAVQAAEAAGHQGRFWDMHDLLFEHQAEWSAAPLPEVFFNEYARLMGLNLEQFRKDESSDEVKDKVERDYYGGLRAGVDGTPTFFLNGEKILPQSYQEFVELVH
ncbi:MAG: DsbA family protein [bacterium]|nr:DsbA family protein [bacterium]